MFKGIWCENMKCKVCNKKTNGANLCIDCWEKNYVYCDQCEKYKISGLMKYHIPDDYYWCSLKCLKEYAKNA